MANQATAKKGEEYKLDSENRVLFERIEKQQKELTAEEQIAKTTGKTEQQILSGENSNIVDLLEYRAKKVQNTIDKISDTLADDPNRQEAAKKVLEKIVSNDELTTEAENVDSLTQATFGSEYTTENEIEAKKAISAVKGIGEKDPAGVNLYKEKKLEESLIEESEKENGSLTDKEKGLLKRKAELINETGSGIDNQSEILENYKNNPGEARNNFRKLGVMTGLAMKSPKETVDILAENEKINKSLGNKIPYKNKRLVAFDEVTALVNKNAQTRKLLGTVQGGGSFLIRFKMFFYNFSQGWVGKRVQSENGFVTRVGGQSATDFIQNSMGLLMGMDFKSSMDRILGGMAGKGVNAALMAKNLAGMASGPVGWLSTAAGFLKKFFGGLGSKLGPGIKKGLGDGFNKGGNWLVKGAMGLITIPIALGALMGTGLASTVSTGVIVGTAGTFAYNQYWVPNETVSGLVSVRKDCDSRMEYVKTTDKPDIKCENMEKYNLEMRNKISKAGYQTRCAVAAAAQYLTIDFPYHIYYGWARYYYGDGISENWCGKNNGMDCNSFIVWAYRQGGFAMVKQNRSYVWQGIGAPFKTEKIPFNKANCARIKEIAKPGDIVGKPGHKAIVIGFDGNKLQIAQEAQNGLTMCYINPCTGSGKGLEKMSDGSNHGCLAFKLYWSMDNFFDYYTSGGKNLNGFAIEPYSEIKSLVTGTLMNLSSTDIHSAFTDMNDIESNDTDYGEINYSGTDTSNTIDVSNNDNDAADADDDGSSE